MVVARGLVEPGAVARLTRSTHPRHPRAPDRRSGVHVYPGPVREDWSRCTPSLQVHPDRESFDRLAADWPLVPVWAEVLADVGTPVGLFPAIAGDGPGCFSSR